MSLAGELSHLPPHTVNILLSHLHLDHISGLGTFAPVWTKGMGVRVFTQTRDERPLEEQVFGIFAPPVWPVSMQEQGNVEVVRLEEEVPRKIGKFTVTGFRADHPDKTLSFHITDGTSSFAHLLDSELNGMDKQSMDLVAKYCRGVDAVVFDAAYSCEDYEASRRGWGHSTVKQGVEIARQTDNKLVIFAHFDQKYSDDELDSWKKYFDSDKYVMAYDGLEIEI